MNRQVPDLFQRFAGAGVAVQIQQVGLDPIGDIRLLGRAAGADYQQRHPGDLQQAEGRGGGNQPISRRRRRFFMASIRRRRYSFARVSAAC